jgi:hypothetical protein
LQITSKAILLTPPRRQQAALLGFFRAVRDGVAAAGDILAGASHGVAAGEGRSAGKQKQSDGDESSHEFSPSEECID